MVCLSFFCWGFWVCHGGDGGACDLCFGFYLGIGFKFQLGYWVLFGFELVAMVVGGEIGLLAMMREREWERDRN